MVSVAKLGRGQAGYYLEKVAEGAEDYYSGEGEAEGYWLGDAAGDLGLQGQVAPDQLTGMLTGDNPATGLPLGLRHVERGPVPGLDRVFIEDGVARSQVKSDTGELVRVVGRIPYDAIMAVDWEGSSDSPAPTSIATSTSIGSPTRRSSCIASTPRGPGCRWTPRSATGPTPTRCGTAGGCTARSRSTNAGQSGSGRSGSPNRRGGSVRAVAEGPFTTCPGCGRQVDPADLANLRAVELVDVGTFGEADDKAEGLGAVFHPGCFNPHDPGWKLAD